MYPAHQTPHSIAPFPRSLSYQQQQQQQPSSCDGSTGFYGTVPTSPSANGASSSRSFQSINTSESQRLVQESLSSPQSVSNIQACDSPISNAGTGGADVPSEALCSIGKKYSAIRVPFFILYKYKPLTADNCPFKHST